MQVVLGATGGIGHWVVQELLRMRERVRVMVRNPVKVKHWAGERNVEVVEGDVLSPGDVGKACEDADCVFHCVNVPYPEWNRKVVPMLENTILAARVNDAKIIFPGNVYVFGHALTDFVREDHPFAPHTKKGKIRARMEQMLDSAWRSERVAYTTVRFPDFYGPYVRNPLYESIFRNALTRRPLTWYGSLDVPTEFILIKDAAEAMVTAALEPSTNGETYHVPGPAVTTAREWLSLVAERANVPPRMRRIPGFMVALAGIFNPLAREFYEMLYLKTERLTLDGSKYRSKFGRLPATPYEEGIGKSLQWFREH